jgi:hypothetical protein
MRTKLYISQIEDPYLQQNFNAIGGQFSKIPFLKGDWSFLEFQIKTTGNNQKIPHTLPYQPKDIILLSAVNGSITFNYGLFTPVYLDINATVTTSPMTVRVFVGRYTEDSIYV